MPLLDPGHRCSRRFAAILIDLERAGGRLSTSEILLRCALYSLDAGHLDELLAVEPAPVSRDDRGWALTAPGRTGLDEIRTGSSRELARDASPWA